MPLFNLNQNQQVTFPIPISIILGGTGASDAASARSNLGAVSLIGNETIAGNKEFTGNIKFLDTTPATNTTTGTTFAGGIGVALRGYFGLGVHAPNLWLLEPRSGTTVINANSLTFGQFAGVVWIDGSVVNLNLPSGFNTGMLTQFDPLFGTASANKYRQQEFTNGSNRYWRRAENNGVWSSWKEITLV